MFVTYTATSIVISLLMLLVDYDRYLYNVLVLLFVVQLIYFTSKAISENKKNDLSKGYRKFFVCIRLLFFYYLLTSFLNGSAITNTGSWYLSLFTPYREKDISELIAEDDPNDNSITLNEFMLALKRKFARA